MPSRTVVTRDVHRPVRRRPAGAVGMLTSALAGGGLVAGHVATGGLAPQTEDLALQSFSLPSAEAAQADPAAPAASAGAARALAEPPPPVDVDEIVGAATGAVDDAVAAREEQRRAAEAAAKAAAAAAAEPDEPEPSSGGGGTGPSSCAAGTEGMEGVAGNVADAGETLRCMFGVDTVLGIGSRGGTSDHPSGKALDFMVDRATGDRLAEYALANRDELGITYVIWRQRIDTGSGWEMQEDRGGDTANHMDHVHISFS
ncbi:MULTISPECIES: hypothetical protein [unclassified Pseudonocardia]|uniref:hypothetical protein n=1 Tax=unclassified Pseudonocardia TaxID=2619320 RepID=UPI000AA53479|nr:hypothetical protein [Pseudonocardia sp. Ae707_Ps1]